VRTIHETRVEFGFAAPVPRGHTVRLLRIENPDAERAGILVDETAGVVYCDESVSFLLNAPDAPENPMRRATTLGWRVIEDGRARVRAAVVMTGSDGAVRTSLFHEALPPSDGPYR
jgi:hypothetical protein